VTTLYSWLPLLRAHVRDVHGKQDEHVRPPSEDEKHVTKATNAKTNQSSVRAVTPNKVHNNTSNDASVVGTSVAHAAHTTPVTPSSARKRAGDKTITR
jgi:hypothetical protein